MKKILIALLALNLVLSGCSDESYKGRVTVQGEEDKSDRETSSETQENDEDKKESDQVITEIHDKDFTDDEVKSSPRVSVKKYCSFRIRPNENTASKTNLREGDEVYLLGMTKDDEGNEWAYCEKEDLEDFRGYILAEDLDIDKNDLAFFSTERDERKNKQDSLKVGDQARINEDRVNLRSEPSTDSDSLGKLSRGERVKIIENDRPSWLKIETDSGQEAYVSAEYLEKEEGTKSDPPISQEKKSGTINENGVNLRKEASSSSESLGKFSKGSKIEILGEENGWTRVRSERGNEGYVSSEFID